MNKFIVTMLLGIFTTAVLNSQSITTYPTKLSGHAAARLLHVDEAANTCLIASFTFVHKRNGASSPTGVSVIDQYDLTKAQADPFKTKLIYKSSMKEGKGYHSNYTRTEFPSEDILNREQLEEEFPEIDDKTLQYEAGYAPRRSQYIIDLGYDFRKRPTKFTSYYSTLSLKPAKKGISKFVTVGTPDYSKINKPEYEESIEKSTKVDLMKYNDLGGKKDHWKVQHSSKNYKNGTLMALFNHYQKEDKTKEYKEYEVTVFNQDGSFKVKKPISFEVPMEFIGGGGYTNKSGDYHESAYVFKQKGGKKINPQADESAIKVLVVNNEGEIIMDKDLNFDSKVKDLDRLSFQSSKNILLHLKRKGTDELIVINPESHYTHSFKTGWKSNPHRLRKFFFDANGEAYALFDNLAVLNGEVQKPVDGIYIYHITEDKLKLIHERKDGNAKAYEFDFLTTNAGEALILFHQYYDKVFGKEDCYHVQILHLKDGEYKDLSRSEENVAYIVHGNSQTKPTSVVNEKGVFMAATKVNIKARNKFDYQDVLLQVNL